MTHVSKTYFSHWWKKDTKNISLRNYKKPWRENGVKPRIGIRTNHPNKKRGDTCFDLFIYLGYIVFNYTNFAWNKRGGEG